MALKLLGKDGFYGWVNLAVMFVFNIAVMLMIVSFAIFLPSWVNEFSWSRGWISGAQTLSLILSGLATPMVGMYIMKRGAKRAIIIGNLLCVLGLFLLAFQTHIWNLYLGYGVLVGIGMSIGGMLAMMTVTNNWFILKRSLALSISMASMGLSQIVMQPWLMMLINTIGWRQAYLIIAGIVLLCCVILPAMFLRNTPQELGQMPDGPAAPETRTVKEGSVYKDLYKTPVDFTAREALRTRACWLLVGYGTLQFLVLNGLMPHQIAFMLDIGISPEMAALAGGVFGAVMAASQLGIGFLGLRFNMHFLAIAAIVIGISGLTILQFARSIELVLAYCIVLGIGFGIQSIAMGNLFPDYFGRSEFPKIMGYTMPFTTIVSSFGAPITGFMRDLTGSYLPAFQLWLAVLVVAFLCILFARPPLHPSLKGKRTIEFAAPANQ
jgi:MFS family permease